MPYTKTETIPSKPHVSDDHTINNHDSKVSSQQWTRNVDQVPFKYGIRGPATIRSRNSAYRVTKA